MPEGEIVTTVRSTSSGTVDRSLNAAGRHHFVIDGASLGEEIGSIDAFLAGVSSCGVSMIERLARDAGLPLRRTDVTIDGVRDRAQPNRFTRVDMRFVLSGLDAAQARGLVERYEGT